MNSLDLDTLIKLRLSLDNVLTLHNNANLLLLRIKSTSWVRSIDKVMDERSNQAYFIYSNEYFAMLGCFENLCIVSRGKSVSSYEYHTLLLQY